jgi:Ser/Thr protein kinase RdoA (MazF antagonist)
LTDEPSLLARLEAGWGGQFELVRPLLGGTISAVTLVERGAELLVAKEISLTRASAQWQAELLAMLALAGFGVPTMLPTPSGDFTHDGIVLSRYIEGSPPGSDSDGLAVRSYVDGLHALTRRWPRRPDSPSCVAFATGAAPLPAHIPPELASDFLRAWAPMTGAPLSVIHGDPNRKNVLVTASGPALIDWEEARVDYSCLDLAGLPGGKEDLAAYTASAAWEAFICWDTERGYAMRRVAEFRRLLTGAE